jgi:hypothetical protein
MQHRVQRPFTPLLVALIVIASWSPPQLRAEASGSPLPDVIYSERESDTAPIWVSTEAATDNSGEINWALLGEQARTIFLSVEQNDAFADSTIEFNPDFSGLRKECVYFGSEERVADPRGTSLDEVLGNSLAIYRGRVIGRAEGFYRGIPGTLLKVAVTTRFKAPATHGHPDEILLYYPYAHFTIGHVTVCKRDANYPPIPPDLGDEIFFFAYGPRDSSPFVMYEFGFGDLAVFRDERQPLLPEVVLRSHPEMEQEGPEDFARLIASKVGGLR